MRTNRPYVQIDPDVLERVRQIDLLSYLREFEPSNLVKVKGTSNVYCTAEHDSLKISNSKWYWWSRGFGGYSALNYLIKVKEYDFVEAVEMVLCQDLVQVKMRNFSHFNPPEAQPQCVFFHTIVRIHLVTYSYNGYEFVSYCRKFPDIRKSSGMPACNREF